MSTPLRNACCDACKGEVCDATACACVATAAAKPAPVRVVTSQGKVSAAVLAAPIVRLSPPDDVDDALRAGGIDPLTLNASPGAPAALDDARYTALAEAILGRLTYRPQDRVWRHLLQPPGPAVVGAGQAPRPTYEALREAHFDTLRWLLMGGACAGVAR